MRSAGSWHGAWISGGAILFEDAGAGGIRRVSAAEGIFADVSAVWTASAEKRALQARRHYSLNPQGRKRA
jgi:hypothetical protein